MSLWTELLEVRRRAESMGMRLDRDDDLGWPFGWCWR